MHKYLIVGIICIGLTACHTEQNYRGVPEATWQQLTPQQKQLIVDQSFQHDINK